MHGKNHLAAQHAWLLKRRGMGRAQVAVAHSMLVAAYWMLEGDEPRHDLGADQHAAAATKRTPDGSSPSSNTSDKVTLNPAAPDN